MRQIHQSHASNCDADRMMRACVSREQAIANGLGPMSAPKPPACMRNHHPPSTRVTRSAVTREVSRVHLPMPWEFDALGTGCGRILNK